MIPSHFRKNIPYRVIYYWSAVRNRRYVYSLIITFYYCFCSISYPRSSLQLSCAPSPYMVLCITSVFSSCSSSTMNQWCPILGVITRHDSSLKLGLTFPIYNCCLLDLVAMFACDSTMRSKGYFNSGSLRCSLQYSLFQATFLHQGSFTRSMLSSPGRSTIWSLLGSATSQLASF